MGTKMSVGNGKENSMSKTEDLTLLSINADVQHILWSLSCIQDKIKKIELLVIAAIILSVATPIICLGVIIRITWMT